MAAEQDRPSFEEGTAYPVVGNDEKDQVEEEGLLMDESVVVVVLEEGVVSGVQGEGAGWGVVAAAMALLLLIPVA